jgi:hypothetical protein
VPTGGVASHFVQMLRGDRRHLRRRVVVLLVVAALLAAPAYFLWPWQGLLVHAIALLAGFLAGHLATRKKTRTYESSLRASWNSWMKYAVACESLTDVHRRVGGRRLAWRPAAMAGWLTVLWAVEVILLAIAFQEEAAAVLAAPVILLNGGLVGFLFAQDRLLAAWTSELEDSVEDLVASGELGVWGVI